MLTLLSPLLSSYTLQRVLTNAYLLTYLPFICRYGLQSDVQVTQADVARLETKFKVSVLRLLYHQSGQQKAGNPNETAFALNFICEQLHAYSQDNPKDEHQKSKS